MGFEPIFTPWKGIVLPLDENFLKKKIMGGWIKEARRMGFEPILAVLKTAILPLNYPLVRYNQYKSKSVISEIQYVKFHLNKLQTKK